MSVWVKICGITNDEDAEVALAAGADALGVNLVPSSKRFVDAATARRLYETVAGRAEVVAVVADLSAGALAELRERTGIRWLQLHGSESPEALATLLPGAYKAVRVAEAGDLDAGVLYGGERLLVDSKVPGELGGTGHSFDWALVTRLAMERPLVLAGGLTPDNVAGAISFVRPFGVDTASGVEGADPRRKDAGKVARFVRAARGALLSLAAFALFGCSSSPPARQLIAPNTPLPGVVAAMFKKGRCSDANGGKVNLGARYFVALAPPGLVGEAGPIERGAYPPAVITLLDQRAGYEGVLLSQARREGDELVFRTPIETSTGRALLEEIRLPARLAGDGSLLLDAAQAGPGGTVSSNPHPVLMRCELVAVGPGLDTAQGVDYEPGPEARSKPYPPRTAP
jgi:phosphoribosylanthranilate isomerase